MENYVKSNPLNAIPENWEMESKTSGLRESQSIKKFGSSKMLSETDCGGSNIKVRDLAINLSCNSPVLNIICLKI